MKASSAYALYIAVGVVTGMAVSLTVCGACNAAVGGWFGPDDRTGISFFAFIAESAAPLIGGFVGFVLARRHERKPPPADDDNPYPPAT